MRPRQVKVCSISANRSCVNCVLTRRQMRPDKPVGLQMSLHLWRRNGSLVNRAIGEFVTRAGGQDPPPRNHHRVLVSMGIDRILTEFCVRLPAIAASVGCKDSAIWAGVILLFVVLCLLEPCSTACKHRATNGQKCCCCRLQQGTAVASRLHGNRGGHPCPRKPNLGFLQRRPLCA